MDKLELPADLPINSALAVRLGTASVFHPFELSKVLMQVGHEPIAPRQSKTLFGTPKLALPSVFQVGRVVLCRWSVTVSVSGVLTMFLLVLRLHQEEGRRAGTVAGGDA